MLNPIEFFGEISLFGVRALRDTFSPPFEANQVRLQMNDVGVRSLPLVLASGFALGMVMSLHTRGTLVTFGATALIPSVQAMAFFVEIGPLVAALLLAGRVGAGIGAVIANMRVTEQIDGIESLSVDSFKFLVVPRVLACVLMLPLLTLFMDFAGLMGGYVAEFAASHLSVSLYLSRAFTYVEWPNFIAPVIKTSVFGFIIGTASSYFGYTTDDGAQGVGRAATNSVVMSSLLIILADVILVKCILFVFPESAL